MFKPEYVKRVLVVDDDNDDNSLFSEALTAVGPETLCYTAGDGHEALALLQGNRIEMPDIIFLDLNMPGMDGWECLKQLKGQEKFKGIPVVIHTTSSRTVDKEHAQKMGAICFFTKMYDYKKLKRMLEIVIDKLKRNATDSICETVYSQLGLGKYP